MNKAEQKDIESMLYRRGDRGDTARVLATIHHSTKSKKTKRDIIKVADMCSGLHHPEFIIFGDGFC